MVGQLYSECNKKIDEHGFAHPKSRALSRAYKDSLYVKKHDLTISLPPELRNEIKDKRLRGLIEINNSPSATDNGDDDYDGTEAEENLTDNDGAEEEGFSTIEDGNSSDDESTGTSGSEESDGCVDYYY